MVCEHKVNVLTMSSGAVYGTAHQKSTMRRSYTRFNMTGGLVQSSRCLNASYRTIKENRQTRRLSLPANFGREELSDKLFVIWL